MNKFSRLILLLSICFIVVFGFSASNGLCGSRIEDLLKADEQGDAKAQNTLGSMYYNGEGVPMEPPLVREFERFTSEEASLFSRNCQTSGVPRQSRGFT